MKIHEVLLREVHEVAMLLKSSDELVIETAAVCLVAHKSGIEIQRSVNYLLKVHLLLLNDRKS